MDLERVRKRLLEQQRILTERRQRIDRHIGHRDEPLPREDDERSIELENRETMELLDGEAAAELRQIERALRRLDDGSYGRCERCGAAIPAARLDVLPFATRCVTCAGS